MAALEETQTTAPAPTTMVTSGSGGENSSSTNSSRPSTGDSSSKISNSLPTTPRPHTSKISTSANYKRDFMTYSKFGPDYTVSSQNLQMKLQFK